MTQGGDNAGPGPGWVVPGYVNERKLGSGSSGQVMLALREATGEQVAIKYLAPRLNEDADFRDAYRREARLLEVARSEHVAQLYEYVETEHGSAIVMELVDGVSLRVLLREKGALAPESALTVLKGSLLGLTAAHHVDVVHRDYKPANVLVTPQGRSKLVDFGLAARVGEQATAAGTPAYMAPEQFAGQPAAPPADVYAATATFFQCVTGTTPYSGTSSAELMAQHADGPIPDERAPEHVRALIRAGLAKSPDDRPADAERFVEELERVARGAYGEDWEEQGWRKLAALIATLPLLLLAGGAAAAVARPAAVAASRTSIPRVRLKRPNPAQATVGAGLALALIALVAFALAATGGTAAKAGVGGTPTAADPPGPTVAPAVPSASSVPSASPRASTSATAGKSPTPAAGSRAPSASAGSAAPGQTPSAVAQSAAPTPSPPVSPLPGPHVYLVGFALPTPTCNTKDWIKVEVTVTTDGSAAGTLLLSWFTQDSSGARTIVATDKVILPAGQMILTHPYTHNFAPNVQAVRWGVAVSTAPAADVGDGTAQSCP